MAYRITIEAEGPHHSPAHPGDADRLAAAFVAELTAAGHKVSAAVLHDRKLGRQWGLLDGGRATIACDEPTVGDATRTTAEAAAEAGEVATPTEPAPATEA